MFNNLHEMVELASTEDGAIKILVGRSAHVDLDRKQVLQSTTEEYLVFEIEPYTIRLHGQDVGALQGAITMALQKWQAMRDLDVTLDEVPA